MKQSYICGCYILMLVFTVIGLVKTADHIPSSSPELIKADAALDRLFEWHLGIKNGATTIRKELSILPVGADILIIGLEADWRIREFFTLIGYVAWPKQVWLLNLKPKDANNSYSFPPPKETKPSAIFFYDTKPPENADQIRIGERLILTRAAL